jgi:putative endonuclease
MYFVYIIRTFDNKLYIGYSNDLERRESEHYSAILGAKFLKGTRADFQIVYSENYPTRAEAMQREKQLKRWTRAKKEALIAGKLELLKRL